MQIGVDGRGWARFTTWKIVDTERRMGTAAALIGGRNQHRVLLAAGAWLRQVAEQGGLVLDRSRRWRIGT